MDLGGIDLGVALIQYVVLLFSLSVHESAHAWTADYLGDYTARYLGRVSLNPLVHIDLLGTVILPIMAIFNPGIPLLGWAKPTPVNPARLRHPRRDNMLVAAAGPASNLLLGFFFLVILLAIRAMRPDIMRALDAFRSREAVASVDIAAPLLTILYIGFLLNLFLALFNLIPIPPLDGSKVLSGLLPSPVAETYDHLSRFGFILLLILMYTGQLRYIVWPIIYLRHWVNI